MKKPNFQDTYELFANRLGTTEAAYKMAVESFEKSQKAYALSLLPPKYTIVPNELMPKGEGIKLEGNNEIHCHPDHMYQFLFMGGVTDEAIEMAGRFALNQVIKRCKL